MKTLTALYKGNRTVELLEAINLSEERKVFVIIPAKDDEEILWTQLKMAQETVFAKLWDNEEDDVWNEYL